jgi:hypothetical protein
MSAAIGKDAWFEVILVVRWPLRIESSNGCSLSGTFPSSFPVEMCEESEVSELSLLLHGLLVGRFLEGRFIL